MTTEANYFDKFPTMVYRGVQCLDITRRVRISDTTLRLPTVFYPFTLTNETRADGLAFDYYRDPNAEWITYLSNGIIDPYYDWHLSEDDFAQHLENKYGSIEETQSRVKYWKTNWLSDRLSISPSYFQNSLPEALKKYWIPVYGLGSRVNSYKRREEDWFTVTNSLERIELGSVDGSFSIGELVDFRDAGGLNVGLAEVVQVGDDYAVVKNVRDTPTGAWTSGETLSGSSGASADVEGRTTLASDIPSAEAVYWSPVTVYDWELDLNEANKQVTLIDVDYVPAFLDDLRKKLA